MAKQQFALVDKTGYAHMESGSSEFIRGAYAYATANGKELRLHQRKISVCSLLRGAHEDTRRVIEWCDTIGEAFDSLRRIAFSDALNRYNVCDAQEQMMRGGDLENGVIIRVFTDCICNHADNVEYAVWLDNERVSLI